MAFKNFDDLFEYYDKKVKEIGPVPFEVLFDESFMKEYTKFKTIDEFLKSSPFEIKSQKDFENVDVNKLDEYVKENSVFSTWGEMKEKAVNIYLNKK